MNTKVSRAYISACKTLEDEDNEYEILHFSKAIAANPNDIEA